MRRFILIDHSLKRIGGHHFDYASHVLQAAIQLKMPTVLAAHRSFRGRHSLPAQCDIHRLFPRTSYNAFTAFSASSAAPRSGGKRLKAWLQGTAEQRIESFARACHLLFQRIGLCPGDIVFLPTLSELDLLGLSRFLAGHPESTRADWHLQFHFNIFDGREADFDRQADRMRLVRQRFAESLRRCPAHRLHFYNTSEPLAEQYNRMGLATFHPLTYPINPAFAEPIDRQRGEEPLRITVAGAMRPEKSPELLAGLIEGLWDDVFCGGQAKLVVQSKFSRWTGKPRWKIPVPDSTPGSAMHRPVCYERHPLSPTDYVRLIRRADIGLLMYDSDRYYARRAGVLCEMLVAGVPVIVPAGCWLAEQIAEPLFQHADALWRSASQPWVRQFGEVTVEGSSRLAADTFAVPRDARILIVRFCHKRPQEPGVYVRVDCAEFNAAGNKIARTIRIVGRSKGSPPASAMFRLQDDTRRIGIVLENNYDARTVPLSGVEVAVLPDSSHAFGASPLGQVGLVATGPDQVPELLREITQHHDHYRSTAAAFASGWFERHDPRRTVEELIQRSEFPAQGEHNLTKVA